jgi:hypothetical protein
MGTGGTRGGRECWMLSEEFILSDSENNEREFEQGRVFLKDDST